ncbi:hypothetical protein SteCoe_33562 [Stentor coeruleus]|uniref:Histone-lysine N-methyltransferase, H3 lysine-79 specific n=1 Tax=Stentor coeruleus TaxID=5963 RepID=A0A1R2AWU8_9CILI|nr:hypothetical protein SteCoe_33562 [Stentor coeruleus]
MSIIPNPPPLLDPSSSLSPSDILKSKSQFLSNISKKFPVTLGESLSWEQNTIYGEVLFETLNEILTKSREKYSLHSGGVFYDLGSGIGKAVISAGLLHNFSTCIGIEVLPCLHSLSETLKAKYLKHKGKYQWLNDSCDDIRFVLGDICVYDWTDATCFFANATCFDKDMINYLSVYPVKSGTIGITTTQRLLKTHWRLLETSYKNMTWGKATVFIHQKI